MKAKDLNDLFKKHKAVLNVPPGFGRMSNAEKIKKFDSLARGKSPGLAGFKKDYADLKAQSKGTIPRSYGGKGGKGASTATGKQIKTYAKKPTFNKGQGKPPVPPPPRPKKPKPEEKKTRREKFDDEMAKYVKKPKKKVEKGKEREAAIKRATNPRPPTFLKRQQKIGSQKGFKRVEPKKSRELDKTVDYKDKKGPIQLGNYRKGYSKEGRKIDAPSEKALVKNYEEHQDVPKGSLMLKTNYDQGPYYYPDGTLVGPNEVGFGPSIGFNFQPAHKQIPHKERPGRAKIYTRDIKVVKKKVKVKKSVIAKRAEKSGTTNPEFLEGAAGGSTPVPTTRQADQAASNVNNLKMDNLVKTAEKYGIKKKAGVDQKEFEETLKNLVDLAKKKQKLERA